MPDPSFMKYMWKEDDVSYHTVTKTKTKTKYLTYAIFFEKQVVQGYQIWHPDQTRVHSRRPNSRTCVLVICQLQLFQDDSNIYQMSQTFDRHLSNKIFLMAHLRPLFSSLFFWFPKARDWSRGGRREIQKGIEKKENKPLLLTTKTIVFSS